MSSAIVSHIPLSEDSHTLALFPIPISNDCERTSDILVLNRIPLQPNYRTMYGDFRSHLGE